MTTKPRVGQTLTTRITFIRDDGRINVSMRPIKEKAINLDAQMLYDTLMARGGKMPCVMKPLLKLFVNALVSVNLPLNVH